MSVDFAGCVGKTTHGLNVNGCRMFDPSVFSQPGAVFLLGTSAR